MDNNLEQFTVEDFKQNYEMIVADDVKKDFKGLSYLSWAKAWRLLKERDPKATYNILTNENGIIWEQLGTYIVRTMVKAFGETKEMWLSIMDNNHNAVKLEPYQVKLKNSTQNVEAMNSNHVSNALMRCLTKNIAMFGIGLKLYEGEDIPTESDSSSKITKSNKDAKKTSQEKLTDLCKEVIEKGVERNVVLDILKKYESTGNTKKMKAEDAKKAYKEIEKLKEEK